MYTGNDADLLDLQAQITTLTGRVNAIDGQNLADPTLGVLNQLSRKYEGLKTDLRQAVIKLEQLLIGYRKTVTDYAAIVRQHLGI
jgi:uncharacterized protein involved in exopolysaccharide biosynthesis